MKAISLLIVLLAAKAIVLAGRDISLSPWMPLGYLWQDLLFVLVFGGLEWLLSRRPWIVWALYGMAVAYTTINVPVACTLSSPLTWPLLRATRGTLSDSILHHATAANLCRMGVVLAVAVAVPLLLQRLRLRGSPRLKTAAIVAALALVLLGPTATKHVATLGLHRNVFAALIATTLPRIDALDAVGDWRQSPFGSARSEDLSRWRGSAAGRN